MIKIQFYLTERTLAQLNILAQESGSSKSELIREAINTFLQRKFSEKQDKITTIHAAIGIWAQRDDLPDFDAIRKELHTRTNGHIK